MMWSHLFRFLYPGALVLPSDSRLYLSFDDGPTPELTPSVLELLHAHRISATFFFQGEQMEKFPHLVNAVRNAGHDIGYHGYRHISGLFCSRKSYLMNFSHPTGSGIKLIRPPYGRIRPDQYAALTQKGKKLVFWTHLMADYATSYSLEKGEAKLKQLLRSPQGAILVFHDGPKGVHTLALLSFLLEEAIAHGRNFGRLHEIAV